MAVLKVSTKLIPNTSGAALISAKDVAYTTKLVEGYLPYEAVDVSVKEELDTLSKVLNGLSIGEGGSIDFSVYALKTDLAAYATLAELDSVKEDLATNYTNTEELDTKLNNVIKIKQIKVGESEIIPDENGVIEIPSTGSGLTSTLISDLKTLNEWINSGKTLTTIDFTLEYVDKINSSKSEITKAEIEDFVDSKGYITEFSLQTYDYATESDLTGYATLSYVNNAIISSGHASSTKVSDLETTIISLQNTISALQGRLKTAEANITALQSGKTPETTDVLTDLTVDPQEINIIEGDTLPTITVTLTYSESGEKTVNISDCVIESGNTDVVDNDLNVVGTGSAVLWISYTDNSIEKYDAVVVIVSAKETPVTPTEVTLTSLTASTSSIEVIEGANAQAVAFTAQYSDGTTQPVSDVTCLSSDESVAKWENSKVSIIGSGSAILTFTYESKSCQITVNVSEKTVTEVTLTSISSSTTSLTATEGDDARALTFTANYSDGSTLPITSSVTCTSGDELIAKWDSSKVIFGNPGTTTLTFSYESKSCEIPVTVKAITLTSLTANPTSITRTVGTTDAAVVLTALYSNGTTIPVTDKVTCTSTNETVAKWEDSKVVLGSVGSATLTFTYNTATCQVSVNIKEAAVEEPTIKQYIGYARTYDRVFLNEECAVDTLAGSWGATTNNAPAWLDPEETKHYCFMITTEDVKSIGTSVGDFTLSDINKGTVTDDSGNVYTIYRTDRLSDNTSDITITLN